MSDRFNKDVRIYYIINDRTKNNILPIIKENILKKSENENDMDLDNNYLINAKYIQIHLLLIKKMISNRWVLYLKELTIAYSLTLVIFLSIMMRAFDHQKKV